MFVSCYVVLCEHDYDAIQIFDDYNEPIGPPIRPEETEEPNENNSDNENEPEGEEPVSEPVAEGELSVDDNEDDMPEQHEDEQHRKVSPVRKKFKSTKVKRPPERSPPVNEPKQPDMRSLLVKVYRGPTKQIDEKPFASWGYFIKYPSEDSVPPVSIS